MNALCPQCGEADGDVDGRHERETGLRVAFACPECGYEWAVPL